MGLPRTEHSAVAPRGSQSPLRPKIGQGRIREAPARRATWAVAGTAPALEALERTSASHCSPHRLMKSPCQQRV